MKHRNGLRNCMILNGFRYIKRYFICTFQLKEYIYLAAWKYPVHVAGTRVIRISRIWRARARVYEWLRAGNSYISLRFLKNYIRPNFPLNRCLARRCIRSTYVDQMAHLRERNDSQAFRIPGTSPSLSCFAPILSRTARRNVQNVDTTVLRERFPKRAYGLIYGISFRSSLSCLSSNRKIF